MGSLFTFAHASDSYTLVEEKSAIANHDTICNGVNFFRKHFDRLHYTFVIVILVDSIHCRFLFFTRPPEIQIQKTWRYLYVGYLLCIWACNV